ncbi:Adenylate cyclase protein [Agrobacterium genomosp. 2 str. CFBP 5494]|uniref:Adenylate cyclase protein n=3 Tax=Rhizobiaceae TaxID=82115 RepID=A0A9W5F3F6_9HYPH|nr:adenylate/guanylate cyclase domain-containing protein [Rhizobium sp. P007]CUX02140.1 Adenylate cyclase protein [Agrobacterium genomosp. 2 str. CFBP 5494]
MSEMWQRPIQYNFLVIRRKSKMTPRTTPRDREAMHELRSASLRFVALSILIANLIVGENQTSFAFNMIVSSSYLGVSGASVIAAIRLPANRRLNAVFVILDAMLVTVVLYEHILANPINANHGLTTSSLVIAFILLNHTALKLDVRLIVLFSTIVSTAWLTMLAIMASRHQASTPLMLLDNLLNQEFILNASFGFTALALILLVLDYDRTCRHALMIDERRMNLSRFFSPTVVSDLENASAVLDLERRNAAIMFVDVRDFTRYSETATAQELAKVLSEYRRIVAGTVFAYGGTVDKFIGDGVMAVFGQPKSQPDDVSRALACAMKLVGALHEWRMANIEQGLPALATGIGLHYGTVLGGVLESGFHDEFTVMGDPVNVAKRLDIVAKDLQSPLVVSTIVLDQVPGAQKSAHWLRKEKVRLNGRKELIDIAYLDLDFNTKQTR